MNGIVANPTVPPLCRLARAAITLGCCLFCVVLVGAVHPRSSDDSRPSAAPAPQIPENEPVLATWRAPIERSLFVSKPAIPAVPVAPRPAVNDVVRNATVLAGSVTTQFNKMLPPAPAPVPLPTPTPAAPRYSVRWMEVTAYCPCTKCCGPRAQGITASGKHVSHNGGKFVAADKFLPFNTKLVIPGYADGQAVPVLDRGGAIKGDKLDVYFPSHQQARQWGRKRIPVLVMN